MPQLGTSEWDASTREAKMKGIALWLATVILYFVALNYAGGYLGELSGGMMATLYVFIPLVGIPFVLMLKHQPREIEEPVPLEQVLRDANFTISHEVTADGGLLLDDPRRQACLLMRRVDSARLSSPT